MPNDSAVDTVAAHPPVMDGAPPDQLIGQRIGEYRLLRQLGRGGMGTVYLAVHESIGQHAAVKVLAPYLTGDPVYRQRFLDEARAASKVSHPGLVKIFDFGQLAGGSPYILMEYLDGESLAARLLRTGGYPSVGDAMRMCRLVAVALCVAHEAGIVHRDLKPENMIIVPDPEVSGGERPKILDFGIAKLRDGAAHHTEAGVLLGTTAYMSPEQCRGDADVDDRADVYGLGVIIYEILAGRLPFEGGREALLHQHIFQEPVPLEERAPEIPTEVAALVGRMLAKPREMRPAMREVAATLQGMEHQPAAMPMRGPRRGTVTETAPAIAPPRQRKRVPWSVVALVLLVFAIGAMVVLMTVLSQKLSATPMVHIPGGRFMMGSSDREIKAAYDWCHLLDEHECPPGIYEREQPTRLVEVSPFSIDTMEVTNEQFAAWLNRQENLRLDDWGRLVYDGEVALTDLYPVYSTSGIILHSGRYQARQGFEYRPVSQVTWYAALHYCKSQDKRLPTEAEWELAARGLEGYRFPWGDDEPRCDGVAFGRIKGQACAAQAMGPALVGHSPQDRTSLSVFDLAGNVSEWVQDRFTGPYQPCSAVCRDPGLDDSLKANGSAERRVIRGGSWARSAVWARTSGRSRAEPNEMTGDIGFRCAR